jgi:hypothetical protein
MNPIQPHNHDGTSLDKLFAGDSLRGAPQEAVTAPTGGSTIDVEARAAINSMILKLQNLGILK